jgi:excisionase family DNA binding protein
MVHQEFDLSALVDALDQRPDLDLVREMVTFLYQALIDAEATEQIGAEPHERSLSRTMRRNGTRPRRLSTMAGDLEIKVPKLRKGSFFPSILERRRLIDQALYAVVIEAYVRLLCRETALHRRAARFPASSPKVPPLLVTLAVVAVALSISRNAVYDRLSAGRLPSVKIGRSRRVKMSDLIALIENITPPRQLASTAPLGDEATLGQDVV